MLPPSPPGAIRIAGSSRSNQTRRSFVIPSVAIAERLTGSVTKTAVQRLAGKRPSRLRAFGVSVAVAVSTGVLTYKALRSGGDEQDDAGDSEESD